MSTEEESSPDKWAHEAWRTTFDELRLYFRTLAAFARDPYDFARRWVAGEKGWMGPPAYMAMSVLLVAPVHFVLFRRIRPLLDKLEATSHVPMSGDAFDIARSVLPYLAPIAVGLCVHPFLRLFGSKRSLFTTVGALFYSYGPIMMLSWLLLPYQYFVLFSPSELQNLESHPQTMSVRNTILSAIQMPVQLYFGVAGLRGAHRLSRGRAALAFVVGTLLFVVMMMVASVGIMLWLKHIGRFPPPR
jgi:hypothetical protein